MIRVSLLAAAVLLSYSVLYAGGFYYIGKDKGGLYMETDQDGSWYIDPAHVSDFAFGETGRYTIDADSGGTFIKTGKNPRYYINFKAHQKLVRQLRTFKEEQPTSVIETRVTLINGNHVLVPVTISNQGNTMQVQMLLDTGASITVLHQEVADRLKLKSHRKASLIVADGRTIVSDMVTLDLVGVGSIKMEAVKACIIKHAGPDVAYQGMLGMNFLKGLGYRIDYKNKVIRWDVDSSQ